MANEEIIMPEAIKVENISCNLGKQQVFSNVSFSVSEGQILGIMGLNGSGKSTVLKCIAGLLKPDSGSIMINGEKLSRKHRQLIGYCPQDNSFLNKLTVRENIEYFGFLYGFSKYEVRIITDKVMDLFSLNSVSDILSENISGGYKRRLNIACGLVHEPKVLLLDEPSLALDPVARQKLWKTISTVASVSKIAVILSSNIMEELDVLSDDIVLLENGISKPYRKREH